MPSVFSAVVELVDPLLDAEHAVHEGGPPSEASLSLQHRNVTATGRWQRRLTARAVSSRPAVEHPVRLLAEPAAFALDAERRHLDHPPVERVQSAARR